MNQMNPGHSLTLPLLLCFAALSVACDGGDKGDGTGDGTGDGSTTGLPCGNPCPLTDVNQFSYVSDLQCEVTEAQSLSNTNIEWADLTLDIQGHTVETPPGISQVRLVVFKTLSWEEILKGLSEDTLAQSDVGLYMTCEPEGATGCVLDDFGLLGSKPGISQYFEQDSGRWLFVLGTDDVEGSRSLACVEPKDDSTNTEVHIDNDSAALTLDVDFQSAGPAVIPAGADVTINWEALSVDGLGNELHHEKIDLLQVASYEMSLSELEDNFFDLPTLSTSTWSMSVTGKDEATLSDLEGDTTFTGIDNERTWLFVLWCSVCENPIPKAIVVLELED